MRSRRSRICWGSSAAIPPTLGGLTFPVQTCSVAVSPASADHAKSPPNGKAPDHRGRGLSGLCQARATGAYTASLLGVAVPGEVEGLVDLGGELFGEGVVQVLTVGVFVEDGGVGEDLRAALGGGALRVDHNLAVSVDGEDGQVAEVGVGEGVDVVGGDEVHGPLLPVAPWGCSPGRRVWGRSPNLVTPSLASGSGSVKRVVENFSRLSTAAHQNDQDHRRCPHATTDTFHDS